MKLISLTQGKFAQVSDSDYEELLQYKWQATKTKSFWYAYRQPHGSHKGRKRIAMHRQILGLTDSNTFCDHIDHDGLNNQRENLRACSRTENNRNKRPHKKSLSRYKGVAKHTAHGKVMWRAVIKAGGKRKVLGYFPFNEDGERNAASAYNIGALKYHGDFAYLNTI